MHGLNIIKRLNQQEQAQVARALEEARKSPINQQLDRDYKELLAQRERNNVLAAAKALGKIEFIHIK
jgi:hypothetical protein